MKTSLERTPRTIRPGRIGTGAENAYSLFFRGFIMERIMLGALALGILAIGFILRAAGRRNRGKGTP
mgnify:CR=1 FL=1